MERRTFVKTALSASAALSVPLTGRAAQASISKAEPFKLKYAPHLGMFKHSAGEDPIDQIKFMADQGFRAFEDNSLSSRDVALQEKIGKTLADLNMEMGVFVGNWNVRRGDGLAKGDPEIRKAFVEELAASVDVAKRVNATWMTIVLGNRHHRLEPDYQTANIVETLKQASAVLEPHGLVMVLEPLNHLHNHPDVFLSKVPHGYLICKAVNSPSCKILFDMYHQQITEGNITQNIDMAYEEVGYFQIGDVPGRKEPTTGEMNYRHLFKHIHDKGYTGILGMEHGNFYPDKDGEARLIQAYREVDSFE
ncbi:hydroxypyruvate isomerase family protein [Flavilitoribacter nigricans]|uniref:Xylose isomerase n=1 Tax=Flavilitoribacter nigricans (strain ATCC 23147 / DSM 23189 / NBRC 102662 / NCIMB 1420 / SS-2) TaxID=1122177 RepID=A0A2D0MZP5_FLAN2|nr:TIM barrel protein [Flavilitoribacter nigricans]PHN01596.1 xylose isomerase [Flavilitoribacter nigricans DSM 23189 = NBRC 102662]